MSITKSGVTADTIMNRNVVTVGPKDSLREALSLMTENHISGLPVLDSRDHCVGVVTATDVLMFEEDQSETAEDAGESLGSYFDPESQTWEVARLFGQSDELPDVMVEEVMSCNLVFVGPKADLREVARQMVDHEIHRILVLDEKRFLHGIISASDFVRLYAES